MTVGTPGAAASRGGLRLVVAGHAAASDGIDGATSEPCAVLKSSLVGDDNVSVRPLTDLFTRLRDGQRIEFVHRLANSTPAGERADVAVERDTSGS